MFLLLALHNTLDSFDLHVYNSLYNTVIQTSVFSYGPKITTHTITYQKFQQGGGEGGMVNGLKYQNFDKKVQYRGGWEVNPMNLQWGDGIDTLSVYIWHLQTADRRPQNVCCFNSLHSHVFPFPLSRVNHKKDNLSTIQANLGDFLANQLFWPKCSLQSALCKCHTPINYAYVLLYFLFFRYIHVLLKQNTWLFTCVRCFFALVDLSYLKYGTYQW